MRISILYISINGILFASSPFDFDDVPIPATAHVYTNLALLLNFTSQTPKGRSVC
jgi:hypothetical protein